MPEPNAEVDYVDAEPGRVIETIAFYDPGLDENSWLAQELRKIGRWQGPHLTYGCGRILARGPGGRRGP